MRSHFPLHGTLFEAVASALASARGAAGAGTIGCLVNDAAITADACIGENGVL
jgi:hypothetical protein